MAIDWKRLGQATPTPTPTPITPPPPGPVPSPSGEQAKSKTPGMFNINVSPGGFAPAMEDSSAAGGDLLDQLNEQVFGQKGLGQLTNQLKFDNPVTDTIGNVGGFVGGLAGAAIRAPFAIPSRVPLGWLPNGADEHFRNLRDDAMRRGVWRPEDEQAWQTVDYAAGQDVLNGGNLKYNFLQDFAKAQNEPDMFPMLSHGPAASLGGVLAQAFAGAFQVPQSLVGRTIAGNETLQGLYEGTVRNIPVLGAVMQPSGPGDRIDETLALSQNAPDQLNEAEKVVVQKLADGSWTKDQALDFMTGRQTELSHDEVTQIVGSVITDPTILASLGSVAVAKIAATGGRAAEAGLTAARVAEGGQWVSQAATSPATRFAMTLSEAAQGNLGRTAKAVRTIIDPLSAIGGNHSLTKGAVTLLSEEGTRAYIKPYGQGAINSVFRRASELGIDLQPALTTYTGNGLRGFAAVLRRDTMMKAGKIEALLSTTPGGVVDEGATLARNGFDQIVDYSDGFRKTIFTAADDEQLARRIAEAPDLGAGRTPAQWADEIAGMSDNEKGLWHALSYGSPDNLLQVAKRDAIAAGEATGRVNPEELVLLNDNMVDNVVAGDLVKAIDGAKTVTAKSRLIESAIGKYPTLRMIGDVPRTKGGIDSWVEYLTKRIDEKAFHSRVLPGEIKSLGPTLAKFAAEHPSWNLGFAPDVAVRWGIDYDVRGLPRPTHVPHVGHVSEAAATFRPTADVARNVLGQVIGPRAGAMAGKLLDPIEVYSRTAAAQVSGLRLVRNFEQRFMKEGVLVEGMTEAEARKMFTAIKDKAFDMKTTLQGMTPGPVWEVTKDLVPIRMRGKLGPREVMNMMMRASEGDLRIVGITSKTTSRIRTMMVTSGVASGNMMGQISVGAYNLLRYSLNPVFITQRVSDMPFFQIIRGVPFQPAATRDEVRRVLQNMADHSVMRNFALENIEYRQHGDFAEILTAKLAPKSGRLSRIPSEARIIQNGQLDYVYSTMGQNVMDSLADLQKLYPEATLPETFAQLRKRYSDDAGRVLNDNEVGLEYLKEQFWAGQMGKPETWGEMVDEGARLIPGDIGELRPLNLDAIAKQLGEKDVKGLRSAMQASDKGAARIDETLLRETLQGWHYPEDQIDRVIDGVKFEWDTFFKDVAVKLELSPRESLQLQAVISATARGRDMVPAEYLSQVMAHNAGRVGFKRGLDALPEALRPTVELMRSAMIGNERERVKTLVNAVYTHLDRSAQKALLEEFQVDIGARIQGAMDAGRVAESQELNKIAEGLRGGWGPEADDALADRILDRMGGVAATESNLPTHVLDETGNQRARFVQPEELDELQSLGQGIVTDFRSAPREALPWLDEAPVSDRIFTDIYDGVRDGPWGGGTFDAHTGARFAPPDVRRPLVEAEGFWYHQSMGKFTDKIANAGVQRGDWVDDVAKVESLDRAGPIYRTNRSRMAGGQEKASGWVSGPRVKAGDLEVSTDGGATWAPALKGPYTGAVGSRGQFSIPIAQAGDAAAVRAVFDDFIRENLDELELPGAQIGVFRNEDTGLIEFDVSLTVRTERESEAVQLAIAQEQTGGWYDQAGTPDDPGAFRPTLRPVKPDVERAVQYVSKWIKEAYLPSVVADRPAVGRGLAEMVDSIPTGDAFAYNKTEAMTLDLMRQNMNNVIMDSHRLADMSKSRSVFMRSLNHPLFGIYPASYMWGKVVPEFVRFMAQTPFGLRTGAMAYAMQDVQMSLAAQYELDPTFQEKVEGVGNSESAFLLSYMLPSFPWEDVAAGVAPGLRSFADRGLSAEMVTRQLDMMSPDRWISSPAGAVGELGDFLSGVGQSPTLPPPPPPPAPAVGTPAGQLEGPLSESQSDLNEVLRRALTGQ